MPKTKTAEPEMKIVETGKVELSINIPKLSPEKAKTIARDIRYTLENCGRLELLNEFIVALRIEYKKVAVKKGAN